MKQLLFILLFICFGVGAEAQLKNINPDKNGDPWIVGGIDVHNFDLSKGREIEIKFPKSDKLALPAKVNNAEKKYFRPIFNQTGGSCSQASGIGYIFTYEMNFLRNLSSDVPENQYPSHFTYNFLNEGSGDNGSFYYDGYDLVMEMGCPNIADYGGSVAYGGNQRWLSGYNAYYNGMSNKIEKYNSIDVSTEVGLNDLKKWLYNHANGSSAGGLANFSCLMTNLEQAMVPDSKSKVTKTLITSWGDEGGHAMTIVGYNDSIKYDVNGDGKFTNNIDINADGKVDMMDWEVGALLFANSWGESWGDKGFAYMMYRLLALPWYEGGISNPLMYIMTARKSYTPTLTLDVQLKHPSRNKLKIYAGITNELNSVSPIRTLEYSAFTNRGGDFYLQGGVTDDKQQIEIGLDITPLKSYLNSTSKIFLMVLESGGGSYNGEIISCKVHNYSSNVEYQGYPKNKPIKNFDFVSHVYGNYPDFSINTDTLPLAQEGTDYNLQFSATGGVPPYSWEIDQEYTPSPSNMNFSADGVFNGIPSYNAVDYKWDLRFVAIDSYNIETGKFLTFALDGEYTSINNISNVDNLVIYPNPADEKISIKVDNSTNDDKVSISIVDLSGSLVYYKTFQSINPNTVIDVQTADLKNGMYLVAVQTKKGSMQKKIIVNHN